MKSGQSLKNKIRNLTLYALLALFCAVLNLAVLYFTLGVSPLAISQYLLAQVGSAVSVNADVSPNPINALNQQLKEKEGALLKKETELAEKEGRLAENTENKTFGYLFLVGGILLILVLLNFYFDYRHRKNEAIK